MFDITTWCNPGNYKSSVIVCLDAEAVYLNTCTCAIRKNGINQNGINMKHKRSKPSAGGGNKKEKIKKEESNTRNKGETEGNRNREH